jgi:hypothetical protein
MREAFSIQASADDAGRFSFAGVAPGSYRPFSWERPFSDPQLLEESYSRGTPVHVSVASSALAEVKILPGATDLPDIILEHPTLDPLVVAAAAARSATVSGQVIEMSGRAIAGLQIKLLRYGVDPTGNRSETQAATVGSDLAGTFTFQVVPGRYYLGAGGFRGGMAQDYKATYHPDAASLTDASAIDVQSGHAWREGRLWGRAFFWFLILRTSATSRFVLFSPMSTAISCFPESLPAIIV